MIRKISKINDFSHNVDLKLLKVDQIGFEIKIINLRFCQIPVILGIILQLTFWHHICNSILQFGDQLF